MCKLLIKNIFLADRAVRRRKRNVNNVELVIGEDDECVKRESSVYCNGPLATGRNYM